MKDNLNIEKTLIKIPAFHGSACPLPVKEKKITYLVESSISPELQSARTQSA
jgi:hypothetical protein